MTIKSRDLSTAMRKLAGIKAPIRQPRRGVMNKTEAAYAARLELQKRAGLLNWYAFEPMTLRLPGGVKYTPDFLIQYVEPTGEWLECHEVKGFRRDGGIVRLKCAARSRFSRSS